jgi:acetylornithine deacetylase/succinyl-diaminopimelate desuccinylase-like protein
MINERLLSWSKQLIGCQSVTNEGTRTIVELCAREILAPLGIEVQFIPSRNEGPEQVNLLAYIQGSDLTATPLVLNTHLDTVPPGDKSLWTACNNDPFVAAIDGERIYGLGAADTKLDFVAKIAALTESTPRRSVTLIATFGEEHGLVGARELAEAGLLPKGALAFIGEPSHLEVITAHKGLMVFQLSISFDSAAEKLAHATRLVFHGRAAHSSTPSLGQNAILMALEKLTAIRDCKVLSIRGGDTVNKVPARCEVLIAGDTPSTFEHARSSAADVELAPIPSRVIALLARFMTELRGFADHAGSEEPNYAAPTLTCNAGVIRSEQNTIILEFELRPPPGLPLEVVRNGIYKIGDTLRHFAPDLQVDLAERRANPGFRSPLDSETVELAMAALATAGLPLATNVKAGCTEAGIYAAAGLKPVVFGPGPSTGVIHAPNEYNLLDEVEKASRFYRELLRL